MTLCGECGTYRLDKFLGKANDGTYRLYRCIEEDKPDRWFIFKIAVLPEHNAMLDREAFLLEDIRQEALDIEAAYKREGGVDAFNYHYICPRVIESFTLEDQDGRRANVLGFDIADDIGDLVALSIVREGEQLRVDPKTSAWIVGKFLKALAFTHSFGVSVGQLTSSNLLVRRDSHLVSVFDWTKACQHLLGVPEDIAAGEIRAVVRAGLRLLSERDGKTIPPSEQDPSGRYVQLLMDMARGRESDAARAHASFYQLVEELWGRKYHPWTTVQL